MRGLSHLENKIFDLIVIGGGIVGAGIARDAALRGLSVALFEKSDYCSGTTARSTRLIHGGLRYLETYDFRLVRLDLIEREILLRTAGHLVRPIPFLVPFYGRSLSYRYKVRAGMLLYDLLGYDKSLPSHSRLSSVDIAAAEPLLVKDGLQGGFRYYDAQAFAPERLVLENIIDARVHGAQAHNYTEVIAALRDADSVAGVRIRDVIEGNEVDVRGRVVVNAAGPWLNQLSCRFNTPSRARMTKGIHLVCPSLSKHALVFFSKLDGRLFFIVPWLGYSLVGTTDTDYSGDPGEVAADEQDVAYLLDSIRPFISIDRRQVLYSYAGVRALVPEEGSPSSISRMHLVRDEARDGAPGLISIVGGKITGYRAIAKEAVDMVCGRLGLRRRCQTAATPLPGSRGQAASAPGFLEKAAVEHLRMLYGTRAGKVTDLAEADARLRKPLAPGRPEIAAQVVYSIRNEQCLRATDFLLRRSIMGFHADQGCGALNAVIDVMGEELNWTPGQRKAELEAHMAWVRKTATE